VQTEEVQKVLDQLLDPSDIVLVAPLHWGLGHATRCVPLIRYIQQKCREVHIASDGIALEFLSKEFPELNRFALPGYNVQYRYSDISLNVLLSGFSILRAVILEHIQIKKIADRHSITVVISDNRLGCFLTKKRSYYITHQTRLLHPVRWISAIGTWLHVQSMKRFDACLIPDFEQHKEAIAPHLSHSNLPLISYFIGPLSHLKLKSTVKKWDITVILSGPEPQRTYLELALQQEIPGIQNQNVCIIRGTLVLGPKWPKTYHILDLASGDEVAEIISSSRLLICRPGYSTIMDLFFYPVPAIFIPTPGQSEQEYLASKLADSQRYFCLEQNQINNIQKTIKSLI